MGFVVVIVLYLTVSTYCCISLMNKEFFFFLLGIMIAFLLI